MKKHVVIEVTLVYHTSLTQTDVSSKSNWIAYSAEVSIFLQKSSILSADHNFTVVWFSRFHSFVDKFLQRENGNDTI